MPQKKTPGPTKSTEPRSTMKKVGALWLGKGKNGTYMSGRIELDAENEMRVLVFKNTYKEQPKHPDYIIYEPEPENETADRQQAQGKFADDNIPF